MSSALIQAEWWMMLVTASLSQFVSIGMVGGLAGYLLLLETGKLDHLLLRQVACILGRRLLLGGTIGVIVYVGWANSSEERNLWLLGTAIIATSPVELSRKVIDVIVGIFTKRTGTT